MITSLHTSNYRSNPVVNFSLNPNRALTQSVRRFGLSEERCPVSTANLGAPQLLCQCLPAFETAKPLRNIDAAALFRAGRRLGVAAPHQTSPDRLDGRRDNPPVIHPGIPCGNGKQGSIRRNSARSTATAPTSPAPPRRRHCINRSCIAQTIQLRVLEPRLLILSDSLYKSGYLSLDPDSTARP